MNSSKKITIAVGGHGRGRSSGSSLDSIWSPSGPYSPGGGSTTGTPLTPAGTPTPGAYTYAAGIPSPSSLSDRRDKTRVKQTSRIFWHAHQNDAVAVRRLLEEESSLVSAKDYDRRTPLHVAALHGWVDVAKCLIEFGAAVNAEDRWRNTPLDDAEGAERQEMVDLLKSHGGVSFGRGGSHSGIKAVAPPLSKKCDWEMDPYEIDFSSCVLIGKGSFGEILKATWRGTPVAVKKIRPSLSDDKMVILDFRHEVSLLVRLRHPNIVQFIGAVTEKRPLMLVTEYLRGGDLHEYLKGKGPLSPLVATNFALDIARGMAYLHNGPDTIIHRDLKPRNILLVNPDADHVKVGDLGLSKLIKVEKAHDVYKMTGETGSYRYMAPEVFKHRKYDKKVDVFSFAMILYEMLEGVPPLADCEAYEAAKHMANGRRPTFCAKGYLPELKELTELCWNSDLNKRPNFLDVIVKLEKIKGTLPADVVRDM